MISKLKVLKLKTDLQEMAELAESILELKSKLDAATVQNLSVWKPLLTRMLRQIAEFVDEHDIIVPELTVAVGIANISLSAKKIEDRHNSDEDKKENKNG